MRVAITGGTGFIGRHLAVALTAEGHEVVVVARGADARDVSVRSRPGVRFVAASVADGPGLAAAVAEPRESLPGGARVNSRLGLGP